MALSQSYEFDSNSNYYKEVGLKDHISDIVTSLGKNASFFKIAGCGENDIGEYSPEPIPPFEGSSNRAMRYFQNIDKYDGECPMCEAEGLDEKT